MELELCLDPDDASRLPRLKLLASAGRGRGQPHRIVWHDSADAALTREGLCLARERNLWRLERLVPTATDPWPPGAPPLLLAEAAELAALGHALPDPLVPAVAFAGRRYTYELETGHGGATLTLARGTFRAVTMERAVSRLCLSGDPPAVLHLATALANEVGVAVPSATLAGEALAAARSSPPTPRRHGAAHLPEGLDLPGAFAFVLGHLTDVILHFAPAAAADVSGPEPVHQMRVALRRLRSAVTVFRPAFDSPELAAAAAGLKALSARLGPTRDWDVFLGETAPMVHAVFPADPRLARLLAAAERRRRECHAALREYLNSPDFRRLGILLGWLAATRAWAEAPADSESPQISLQEFAAAVLDRRLRKLRNGEDLDGLDMPALHAVRLKAKRTRYAAEIFAPLYPGKALRRFIERLAEVQDGLGKLNDRATAETLLAELGGPAGRHGYAVGIVMGFAAAGTSELLPRVTRRWEKFQKTDAFW